MKIIWISGPYDRIKIIMKKVPKIYRRLCFCVSVSKIICKTFSDEFTNFIDTKIFKFKLVCC